MASNELSYGVPLEIGQSMVSASGETKLIFHDKGDFQGQVRLYHGTTCVWAPDTDGKLGSTLVVQRDGSLCINDINNNQIWTNGVTTFSEYGANSYHVELHDNFRSPMTMYAGNTELYVASNDTFKTLVFKNHFPGDCWPILRKGGNDSPDDDANVWSGKGGHTMKGANTQTTVEYNDLLGKDHVSVLRSCPGGSVKIGIQWAEGKGNWYCVREDADQSKRRWFTYAEHGPTVYIHRFSDNKVKVGN